MKKKICLVADVPNWAFDSIAQKVKKELSYKYDFRIDYFNRRTEEDLFYELKQVLVQHSPKWDTLCDIEQYIIDLEKQLGAKQKIIDEATEYISQQIYSEDKVINLYKILEILERGKNVNSK